jgi:hypothetical protein
MIQFNKNIDLSAYLISDFKIKYIALVDNSSEEENIDNIKIVST